MFEQIAEQPYHFLIWVTCKRLNVCLIFVVVHVASHTFADNHKEFLAQKAEPIVVVANLPLPARGAAGNCHHRAMRRALQNEVQVVPQAECTPMYFASARFISRRWFPILPEAVARLTSSLAFFVASRFATQVSHCTLGSFHSLCAGEFVDEKCCCIIKTLSYFKIAPNSPHAANRSSSYDVKTSARPIRSS